MSRAQRIRELESECKRIQAQIEELRDPEEEKYLQSVAESMDKLDLSGMSGRRHLRGHFGKVYSLQWASDSKHLVSASQDGKLLIWNAFTTNKVQAIVLRSSWVMTCGYAPNMKMVASGGLDNLVSIYPVNEPGANAEEKEPQNNPTHELSKHEGYISCVRFTNDNTRILSAGGDGSIYLWDIESKKAIKDFCDHEQDVMYISWSPDNNLFVSGSVDSTAKVWDVRASNHAIATFSGHESDINAVDFFPDGHCVASGSDDSTCRMFDTRTMRQCNVYSNDQILCGITSIGFSKTGRILFAGYDDYTCYAWDALKATSITTLSGHENRISCLGVSPDGKALATGSWDQTLKIWA